MLPSVNQGIAHLEEPLDGADWDQRFCVSPRPDRLPLQDKTLLERVEAGSMYGFRQLLLQRSMQPMDHRPGPVFRVLAPVAP